MVLLIYSILDNNFVKLWPRTRRYLRLCSNLTLNMIFTKIESF
jgi:hypothetical protein